MAELSFEELDRVIREICLGEKVVSVEDGYGNNRLVIIKHPTAREVELSQLVYDKALLEAKKEGLLSVSEMQEVVEARNLFTKEDRDKLDRLQSKLDGQLLLLQKTTRVPARRDRIKEIISNLEKE